MIRLLFGAGITLAFLIVLPSAAEAQLINTRVDDIVIELTPELPKPYNQVTARLQSYLYGIDQADIRWQIGDEVLAEGVGLTSLEFQVGSTDEPTILEVVITIAEGLEFNKRLFIRPTGFDVVWEAQNVYAPPFYRGKKLVPEEGEFRVSVLPADPQDADKLTYTWRQNGSALVEESGFQASSIDLINNYLDPQEFIQVEGVDRQGRQGAGTVTIRTQEPRIIFGRRNTATRDVRPVNQSVFVPAGSEQLDFVALPYFFSLPGGSLSLLNFTWRINGQIIQNTSQNPLAIELIPAGDVGASTLQLEIEHPFKFLQTISSPELRINFFNPEV